MSKNSKKFFFEDSATSLSCEKPVEVDEFFSFIFLLFTVAGHWFVVSTFRNENK